MARASADTLPGKATSPWAFHERHSVPLPRSAHGRAAAAPAPMPIIPPDKVTGSGTLFVRYSADGYECEENLSGGPDSSPWRNAIKTTARGLAAKAAMSFP